MSLVQLSKKISRYTTRGLLVAMIFVAGLAVGRQVLRWWHADASTPGGAMRAQGVADGLGDPACGHRFQFGDARWSMRRAVVRGDEAKASAALVAAAAAAVSTADAPSGAPTEAERSLLETLAKREPVARGPGGGRIYTVAGPFPLVAAVRTIEDSPLSGGKRVARSGSRVVTWGVAAPTVEETWSLYTFWPADGALSSPPEIVDIPLPPGSARGLVVQVDQGGKVTTFRTPEPIDLVVGFYERWFGERGWQRVSVAQERGAAWGARFVSVAPQAGAAVDLQLRSAATYCEGLLVLTPAPVEKKP